MAIIDAAAKASGPSLFASLRATLALSWPIMLTNLGQTAMTATDVLMMGRLGSRSLAAGALGSNLYFAPLIFGLGLMLATSPMIAVEIGRRRHSVRDIRRTVRQGLWLAIAVSVPIWLLLWNTEPILRLMGQDAELSAMAASYVKALQWSVLPFFAYIVLRSFISALERPGWALAVVFGAVGFNVLANWCLMFGNLGFPALGLPGSGLATALSSTLMFAGLVLAVCTDRQFRRYRLFGRFWRADWPRFAGLLGLGLPIAALMLFEVTIFNAAAFLMGLIGGDSLAAHAIAIQIASLTFMIPLGLGQAATIRVGRAFGAGDRQGIARAGWVAYGLGVGFMATMALLMVLFPRVLIGAFIDLNAPENAEVARLAVGFLAFAALFQIVDGAQAVSSGMLRGLHDTKVPMLFAALGYWGIGMPLGALLAFHFEMGGNGIWIGLFSGLATVAILLLLRWLRRDRLLTGMP
ncbi:MATE family efflux transporter [Corticibacterium sp. UT-5YL-CI-8]|nr:MATE family efflux transporter [Tianweitania sp. UT-5YL-CI-8]